MVAFLRIFSSISRLLLFTVLDQLQNQRRLMPYPCSRHRISRLVSLPSDAPTRPSVQARKYLEGGPGGALPGVGRGAGIEIIRIELELAGLARRRTGRGCAGRREHAVRRGARRAVVTMRKLEPSNCSVTSS